MGERKRENDERGAVDAARPPAGLGEMACRAARSNCTLLITGETGVGKGHLAKWLHDQSPRHDGPFIPVNCGAIPESLIDSQLFGHDRGAFSGADRHHLGLVRAAERGTLFLDEVGELPPSAQNRLLRLLQDREVQPVGHPRPVVVDVRILAATNADLHERVERRRFRSDLLFRLDIVRLHMLPLRERREEITGLLRIFNDEFSELYGQPPLDFEPAAAALLKTYRWPGNIRQLRTVIERLHVLSPDGPVTAKRLIEIGHGADGPAPVVSETPRNLHDVRHEELVRVLRENGGSVARAAAAFGVHRSTIYRWLRHRGQDVSTQF